MKNKIPRDADIISTLKNLDAGVKGLTGRPIAAHLRDLIEIAVPWIFGPPPTENLPEVELEEDPYFVLGVNETASNLVVKFAHRRLAWDAHPDRGGSTERMARINAAFTQIKKERGFK